MWFLEPRGTLPIFQSDVKARHDKMVVFTWRVMSDKRGTMSAGRGNAAKGPHHYEHL
jgi:uncharacterized protein YbaA (DUF1428 family)